MVVPILVTAALALAGAADVQRAPSSAAAPALPARYLSALASYRAGDLATALAYLAAFDDAELPGITKALTGRGAAPDPASARMIAPAALLHTEAFLIRADAGPVTAYDAHLLAARTLVQRLIQLSGEREAGVGARERMLPRDWYLLLVAFQQGRGEIGWSTAFLKEALNVFPADAMLTLASGSNHEILSDLSAGMVSYVDTVGRFRRQSSVDAGDELDDASRLFKAAAAAAPELVEARLRLGRVLYRQGQLDAAARELDAAIQLPAPNEIKYLGLLFRGLVEAARGQYTAADTFYAGAIRLMPLAQTATLARSEAAYLGGRPAEAAAAVQTMLAQSRKEDPWWMYIQGEAWHYASRRAEIRRYVEE